MVIQNKKDTLLELYAIKDFLKPAMKVEQKEIKHQSAKKAVFIPSHIGLECKINVVLEWLIMNWKPGV